jgi:S-adenosylmethionine synthetase
VAHWLSGELGRRLFAQLRADPDLAATFGPDFKILASLEVKPGELSAQWQHPILSVQHAAKLPCERQHRILLPLLEQILSDLEDGGLKGVGSTLTCDKVILNGAGEFAIGGPEGDNGLSGKKLIIDHYGPSVPIGGGRSAARIRTRWTNAARCEPACWRRNWFAKDVAKLEWSWAGRQEGKRPHLSRHGLRTEA